MTRPALRTDRLRVYAMARPARPIAEAVAVAEAFATMPSGLSARAKAKALAAQVVRELVADLARVEAIDRALADARQALDPDPVVTLARDPDNGLAERFLAERMRRFEARGCMQIGALEWERETAQIAAAMLPTLEQRYRRVMQESGRKPCLRPAA